MANPIRLIHDSESNAGATQTRQNTPDDTLEGMPHEAIQDHYSVLLKVIADASSDPARLRRLVYAMACHDIRLDNILAGPMPSVTKQARTILELEQTLQLERAIKRLESQSAPFPDTRLRGGPEAAFSATHDGDATERARGRPDDAGSGATMAEAPMRQSHAMRLSVTSLLHVCAATATGAGLFLGVSAWIHWVRLETTPIARVSPPQVLTGEALTSAALPSATETVGLGQPRRIEPPAALPSNLSFALPVRPGVYAGNGAHLIELEPLPVEIPAPRTRLSAEITMPSGTVVSGGNPTFVVFKPNLAPGTFIVSARVVARVTRAVTFVDLKARVTPLPGSWRVRDLSYEFRATPIEGRRDMIAIQPESVLPAGRYALVLDGHGYDFAVAGPITAPAQCLEQTQVVNGVVIAECPGY